MREAVDDATLVTQVAAGDRQAFDELMRRHEDRVFSICLRIMRHREQALDATQDAFLTVFRKAAQFRGESTFSTWLYRVAVNTCYDHLRKAKRRPADPLPEQHSRSVRRRRAGGGRAARRPDRSSGVSQ